MLLMVIYILLKRNALSLYTYNGAYLIKLSTHERTNVIKAHTYTHGGGVCMKKKDREGKCTYVRQEGERYR